MPSALNVRFDVPEPAINQRDRQAILVDGRHWDALKSESATYSNQRYPKVYVDPVTYTAMLVPLPFTPQWNALTSGNYARFVKANYRMNTPSKWFDESWPFSGNNYLVGRGTNEPVETLQSFPKNQAFYVSYFPHGTESENFEQFSCIWGTDQPGGENDDLSLRFWRNGQVDFYRGNAFLGSATISPSAPSKAQTPQTAMNQIGAQLTPAYEPIKLLLIPCRRRELLIISSQSGGFGGCNFVFEDIDPKANDPQITRAGRFKWTVPAGQPRVLLAPLKYAASGYVLSNQRQWRHAPAEDAEAESSVYYSFARPGADEPAVSLTEADGVTAFEADGSKTRCRVKVTLSGDNSNTPFLYGAQAAYPGEVATTANSPTSVDDFLLRAQLDVPDSAHDESLSLEVMVEHMGVTNPLPQMLLTGNRPIEARLGSIAFFRGRTSEPRFTDSVDASTQRVEFEARNRWRTLEHYAFSEETPLDGMLLSDAIRFILNCAGFSDSDLDVPDIDFNLDEVGDTAKGEWALKIEVGDTAASWVEKLWREYAQTYFYGFVPTTSGIKFWFKSPAEMPITPAMSVYVSNSDSVADGNPDGAFRTWIRTFKEAYLLPEGNSIYVTGRNPRTGKPLQASYNDLASQDPTIAPADRADNWLGELWPISLIQPQSLTSQQSVNWACRVIAERTTKRRRVAEWDSDFLIKASGVPLWRGEVLLIKNVGRYRILSLSGDFILEEGGDLVFRNFHYVGEYLGPEIVEE